MFVTKSEQPVALNLLWLLSSAQNS